MKVNNKKGKAIILLYHQVGENPIEQTNLDCYCDLDNFEEQMAFLNDSYYKVIGMNELVNKINFKKKDFDEDYIVLTFDDGCEKFSTNVFPILKKYNFSSTIYPVVGCLGQIASWPKVINPDLRIISELDLKYLSDQGVDIGAHTINHIKLSTCEIKTAIEEITKSKNLLEKIINKEVTSFSYPHGDYNKDISYLVKYLGFTNAVTCNSEYIHKTNDLFELPRKYITYFDNIELFKKKLTHE